MSANNGKERMSEIVSVFINHGIGKGLLSINIPVSMRKSFEELGPTFIKIGQILSMRSDLLPETYITELQKLQNDVKPESYEDIKNVIEKNFKKPINEVFLKFEKKPIASASIAQVHIAYLKDNTKVVVKVQRTNVKESMLRDIAILKKLVKYLKRTPQNKVISFSDIAEELEISAKKELNFINESNNIKKFYKLNKNIRYITCPIVYDDYTTNEVLVMDYIDGIKISSADILIKEGYDENEIGLKLANNYIKQIFEDGYFHADPHPGNIIIKDKKIAYIDFGMMGTLNKPIQEKFNKLLYGMASRDIDELTNAALNIGIRKGEINLKKFQDDIEEIYFNYIETSLDNVDLNKLLNDMFNALRKNNMSIPREITMLLKGLITIEGVLMKLSPGVKITELIIPYVKKQLFKNLDLKKELNDSIINLYFLSKSAPKIARGIINLIDNSSKGRLKIQMEHTSLEQPMHKLSILVDRLVFSIIIASIIMGSSIIVSAEIGPKFYGISSVALVGYIGALIMGFWLLITILRSGI